MSYIGKGVRFSRKPGHYFRSTNHLDKEMESMTLTFDYLVFSMGLRNYPGADKNFFGLIGCYISYMLSTKNYKVIQSSDGEKIYEKEDLMEMEKENLQKIDVGFTMGAGYEFDMGLIVSLTGDMGLISVSKTIS
jgi:hypothetical protein